MRNRQDLKDVMALSEGSARLKPHPLTFFNLETLSPTAWALCKHVTSDKFCFGERLWLIGGELEIRKLLPSGTPEPLQLRSADFFAAAFILDQRGADLDAEMMSLWMRHPHLRDGDTLIGRPPGWYRIPRVAMKYGHSIAKAVLVASLDIQWGRHYLSDLCLYVLKTDRMLAEKRKEAEVKKTKEEEEKKITEADKSERKDGIASQDDESTDKSKTLDGDCTTEDDETVEVVQSLARAKVSAGGPRNTQATCEDEEIEDSEVAQVAKRSDKDVTDHASLRMDSVSA